jgi:hypothetical protein
MSKTPKCFCKTMVISVFVLSLFLQGCRGVGEDETVLNPESSTQVVATQTLSPSLTATLETAVTNTVVVVTPSATPTLSMTPTPSTTPTLAPTTNPESQNNSLSGFLYAQIFRGDSTLYSKADLAATDFPAFYDTDQTLDPVQAENRIIVGLSFAPYSDQVAYLTNTDGVLDLWMADLDFAGIEHLWTDTNLLFGDISDPASVFIQWGPAEKSLLVSSVYPEEKILVHTLEDKKAYESVENCSLVAELPESNLLTAWCAFEGAPDKYGYFTREGDFLLAQQAPEEAAVVFDWAFSKDTTGIAYMPKLGNLVVVGGNGKVETTLYRQNHHNAYRQIPEIQWSDDGSRLLVYGMDKDNCFPIIDPLSGEKINFECWVVIGSEDGKVLWSPLVAQQELEGVVGSLEAYRNNCAVISPAGDWIIFCLMSGAINEVLLLNTQDPTGEIYPVTDLDPLNFKFTEQEE